jgi:hypothetical protein
MEAMKNRLEIEREYTLTPKVQKLNQKIHCRARGRHVAWSSRAITTRRRRHTVKNHFVPLLTLLVCLFLRHRDALDGKRSFSDHARTTRGLQNWTLCTTKHLPTRHRLRPHHRRWPGGAAADAAGAAGPGAAGPPAGAAGAAAAMGKNK